MLQDKACRARAAVALHARCLARRRLPYPVRFAARSRAVRDLVRNTRGRAQLSGQVRQQSELCRRQCPCPLAGSAGAVHHTANRHRSGEGFSVSADPEAYNPTKLFIRVEFKDEHAEAIRGRHAWEQARRTGPMAEPVVLTGGARPVDDITIKPDPVLVHRRCASWNWEPTMCSGRSPAHAASPGGSRPALEMSGQACEQRARR